MDIYIRWSTNKDLIPILSIENQCFNDPWTEEDFKRAARQRNTIMMSALYYDEVVGYILYELNKHYFYIMNMAIRPDIQRLGVGTQLIKKMRSKLSMERRKRISADIRETNIVAQQFFRKMGFRCISIGSNHWRNCEEDAYRFVYSLGFNQPKDNMITLDNGTEILTWPEEVLQ